MLRTSLTELWAPSKSKRVELPWTPKKNITFTGDMKTKKEQHVIYLTIVRIDDRRRTESSGKHG